MSQHSLLRERYEQHKIKNEYSNIDDKNIKNASKLLLSLLKETYTNHTFELHSNLMFSEIEEYSKNNIEIDFDYNRRKIQPDGGVIWMDNKYPILITEMKRQGTNNERVKEGLTRQATGNAIERLGKNLLALHTLYQNDDILPFICFCWGCDFNEQTVLCKLYAMNNFKKINILYTDNYKNYRIKPINILIKENQWSIEELLSNMIEICSYSIQYYINKGEIK